MAKKLRQTRDVRKRKKDNSRDKIQSRRKSDLGRFEQMRHWWDEMTLEK